MTDTKFWQDKYNQAQKEITELKAQLNDVNMIIHNYSIERNRETSMALTEYFISYCYMDNEIKPQNQAFIDRITKTLNEQSND